MRTYTLGLTVSIALAMSAGARAEDVSTAAEPAIEAAGASIREEGVPGGVDVAGVKMTANVTAVDRETRKVTIVGPSGESTTFTCGPEVINFEQIDIGDQITVALMTELAVHLRKAGEPAESEEPAEAYGLVRAPVGEKPAGMATSTKEITAVVESIDLEKHTGTLRLPDGTTKTVKARKDVDLAKVAVGDEIVIRLTEAVAIAVETP